MDNRTLRVLIQPAELDAEAREAVSEARAREDTPEHAAIYHVNADGRRPRPGYHKAYLHWLSHKESAAVAAFYEDVKRAVALLERVGVLGE